MTPQEIVSAVVGALGTAGVFAWWLKRVAEKQDAAEAGSSEVRVKQIESSQELLELLWPKYEALEKKLEEMRQRLEDQGKQVSECEQRATDAERRGQDAERRATAAQHEATEAQSRAVEAQSRATEAQSRATEAERRYSQVLPLLNGIRHTLADMLKCPDHANWDLLREQLEAMEDLPPLSGK